MSCRSTESELCVRSRIERVDAGRIPQHLRPAELDLFGDLEAAALPLDHRGDGHAIRLLHRERFRHADPVLGGERFGLADEARQRRLHQCVVVGEVDLRADAGNRDEAYPVGRRKLGDETHRRLHRGAAPARPDAPLIDDKEDQASARDGVRAERRRNRRTRRRFSRTHRRDVLDRRETPRAAVHGQREVLGPETRDRLSVADHVDVDGDEIDGGSERRRRLRLGRWRLLRLRVLAGGAGAVRKRCRECRHDGARPGVSSAD